MGVAVVGLIDVMDGLVVSCCSFATALGCVTDTYASKALANLKSSGLDANNFVFQ